MQRHHADRFKVYASAPISDFPKSVDAAKQRMRRVEDTDKKRALATINGHILDYSWLKGASETYQISPDIKSYVLTEVPIVTIGYPNRNLHCFSYDEASYFDPKFGKFVYQTFIGKPTFADHDNRDFTKAKGIHFDATLRKVPGWDVWKIYVLLGYCRQKDPVLANKIERGQRRGYSMGAWVSAFISSLTGQITNGNKPLKYPPGTVHDGILSYSLCTGVDFFECLAENTLVKTTEGNICIRDIKDGMSVFSEFGRPIRVKRVFDNGLKEIADLVDTDGNIIASCTSEHRWMTANGEVKKVKDLISGECIRMVTGEDTFKNIPVVYGANAREGHTFDIHVDSESNLYLLANGAVTHNTSSVESPADVSAESHQLWYF